MKEERLNVGIDDFNSYLVQAQQMRSRELARIGGRFFKLPQTLLSAVGSKTKAANKAISQGS